MKFSQSTVHASFVGETLLYVVRWPYNTDTYVGNNLTLQTWLLVHIPNSLVPWLLEKWECLGTRLHSNHLTSFVSDLFPVFESSELRWNSGPIETYIHTYTHRNLVGVVMNVILKQFIILFRSIGNAMYKGDVRVLRMLVIVVSITLTSAFISSHYSVKCFSFCVADLSTSRTHKNGRLE